MRWAAGWGRAQRVTQPSLGLGLGILNRVTFSIPLLPLIGRDSGPGAGGGGHSALPSPLCPLPPEPPPLSSAQRVKQGSQSLHPPLIFPNFEPGPLHFPWAGGRNPYCISTSLGRALSEGDGDAPVPFNLPFADAATGPGSHLRQQRAGQTLSNSAFADVRWV